jgi:hypothetical protein
VRGSGRESGNAAAPVENRSVQDDLESLRESENLEDGPKTPAGI